MKKKSRQIILASASRRRSDILSSCGIGHEAIPSNIKEIHPAKKHIISSVIKNAERKVRGIYKGIKDTHRASCIIGADTLVALGNEVIGKPVNERDAKNILRKFSNADIDIYTGLFIIDTGTNRFASGYEKSSIHVSDIPEKKIDTYFKKLGISFDKAGGFSIEGAGSIIFDNVKGSYFNILGLPMGKLNSLFSEIDIELLDFCDK